MATLTQEELDRLDVNIDAGNVWAEGGVNDVAIAANGLQIKTITRINTDAQTAFDAVLQANGFLPAITYAAAISFGVNDKTKTVLEAGVVYAPLVSALPFTTSGTFIGDDDARFYVIQGIVEGNLHLFTDLTFDSVAAAKLESLVAGTSVETQSFYGGWAVSLKGPIGGAPYVVVTKAEHDVIRGTGTVDEVGDHTLPNTNVLLLTPKDGVYVSQYGGRADGAADDTIPIDKTLNNPFFEGRIEPGDYRTTATIATAFVGATLVADGNRFAITITADHILGPVIEVGHSQCVLKGFIITASNTRNAAAVTTDNYGLQIGSTASNFLTSGLYEGLIVTRQPADAIQFGGEGVGTVFDQVSAQFNRGHGWFCDDGTTLGATTTRRNGGVKLLNCRSQGNGGNGFNGSQANGSNYRYLIENMECFDNAWNTLIPGLLDYQLLLGGENMKATLSGIGDPSFADTVQPNLDSRLAKGQAGNGVFVRTGSDHIDIINNRFITLTESVVTGDNINGLNIDNNLNTPLQAVGFRVGSGCLGLRVVDPAGNYTTTLISESGGGEFRDKNFIHEVYPSSSLGIHFLLNKSLTVTITGGTLDCLSATVDVKGEGDVIDTVTNLRFSQSLFIQDGWTIKIVNRNAYTITLFHATGNIFGKGNLNIVLDQDEAASFSVVGSNAYEI